MVRIRIALLAALLVTPHANAVVSLAVSPYSVSPSHSGGAAIHLGIETLFYDKSILLSWIQFGASGPLTPGPNTGSGDLLLSSALLIRTSKVIYLGSRVGLSNPTQRRTGNEVFGAVALRASVAGNWFFSEFNVGLFQSKSLLAQASFGISLY